MNLLGDVNLLETRSLGLGGRGAHLVIPSLLGPVIASVLVFNRVYWRIALVHTLGLDDLCITLSLVFLYALGIVNIVAVDHGYGRAATSLSTTDLHTALQMFYLDQIFYKFTINLTKLSILCLYLRIFSQTWFRRTCWTCVVLIFAYAISSIVATIFQCTPIPRFWNRKLPGTCIDVTAFWYANAIYNIITDIVILASVPPVVWKLRLPQRQKLGLTVVFGLGVFVFCMSILRMTTLDVSSKSIDATHGTLISTMWTMIEASTAIVCACLPMLRTPIQRLVPKIFPSNYASGSGKKAGVAPNMPATPATNAVVGSRARAAEDYTMGSDDDNATLTARDVVGGEGDGDLEMGFAKSWPKRMSSAPRPSTDSVKLSSLLASAHKRLPSLGSEPASPVKVDAW